MSLKLTLVRTAIVAVIFAFAVVQAQASTHNVKFTGGVEKKFTNLDKVLDKLLETMNTPSLWNQALWNGRVSGTGKTGLTNYKLKDIVADFKKYLTDGSLTLNFRLDTATNFRAAGSTTKNRISLNRGAGSWQDGGKTYTDYQLARTIFHELMHDWQHYHWWSTGEYIPLTWDKETVAEKIETYLPSSLFDGTKHPDPGTDKPVPQKTEIWRNAMGVWQLDGGARKIRIYESEGEIVGTIEDLGDWTSYQLENGDLLFDQGKVAGPDRIKGRYFSYMLKDKKPAPGHNPAKNTSIVITAAPDGNTITTECNVAQFREEGGVNRIDGFGDKVTRKYNRVK